MREECQLIECWILVGKPGEQELFLSTFIVYVWILLKWMLH
jgi:hypothetical protein